MSNFFYLLLYLVFSVEVFYTGYIWCHPKAHGRYTRDVDNYQLAIPHKLTYSGKFLSFSLPHYFKHGSCNKRRKKSADDAVNYGVFIDGKYYHLMLWPNNKLLSPRAFIEHRDLSVDIDKRKYKILKGSKVCHYTGSIKDVPNSSVALSTCDGLAGYIRMNGKSYFVEPLREHGPDKRGHHIHLIHKRKVVPSFRSNRFCGTADEKINNFKQRRAVSEWTNVTRPFSKRTTHKSAIYIEVLAVCDKFFVDRHRHIDMQNYILTIFNMVSDLYHDASLGNIIYVTLVRIIYFDKEEDQIDITITSDAFRTLHTFCAWQQTLNPKDTKSPIHHDVAVLITKYDICNFNTKEGCQLLGLAYIGTVCVAGKQCLVAEEAGLSVGYVITHEIGHLLGCPDDDFQISGCNPRAPDGSYHIMSRGNPDNVTTWSKCSRDYITTLFANGYAGCLDNEPVDSPYHFSEVLPGVVYDGNAQCDWIQRGSKLCPYSNHEICTGLMCNPINTEFCVFMNGRIAMPGTPCGYDKWCYKTRCVERGKRPGATDGGWSEWNEWGACSRSCGGGVAFRSRRCDSPRPERGGRYCAGDEKQVKICNAEPCPRGAKEFRAVQCAEFDDKPINNRVSKWTPIILQEQPCVLYCEDEHSQYSKLGIRVKDGTKCALGRKDACISGVCRKIGCDLEIDSDAVEDTCGVCGGNGNTCTVIEATYKGVQKVTSFVFKFPRGAYGVKVTEVIPSENTIALGNEEGKLCLNDNNKEYADGIYDCFNMSFVYTHPEQNKELLTMTGPLTQPLSLYIIFYVVANVSYNYGYADLTMPRKDYNPKYSWEHIEFSQCSYICEGGVQMSEASCVEEKTGKLNHEFCKGIDKPPPVTRTCNERPCNIRWRVGSWSTCRACGGKAGIKVREVECVKESRFGGGDEIILEGDKCKYPKPDSSRYCSRKRKCTSKRSDSGFPDDMMKELFYQTMVDMLNIDTDLKEYFVSQARTIRALRRHLRYYKRRPSIEELCALMMASTVTTSKTSEIPLKKVTAAPKSRAEVKTGALISGDKPQAGIIKVEESKHKIIKGPNNGTSIEIGATVSEHKSEDLNIIEVHSGGMVPVNNISEEAFQLIGKDLENTLVFDSKRNYSGKKAEQCLLSLQKLEGNSSGT